MMEAFGTDNRHFMRGILQHLANAARAQRQPPDEAESVVIGLKAQG